MTRRGQYHAVIYVGLSGWSYRDWQGSFYPPDLPSGSRLPFVAERFRTVEVNRSFYSLLRPDTYRQWRRQVPADFKFSVKGSRYITHLKRLRDVDTALANFLASGVLELGDRLGAILWQLPANSSTTVEELAHFISELPRSTEEAVGLARGHDDRVAPFQAPRNEPSPIRHALEIRDLEHLDADVVQAAEEHNVAIVVSDASEWPTFEVETADFAYLRLHGPGRLYSSGYTADQLSEWRATVEAHDSQGRDVFVYFDNDSGAHAPRDAASLMRTLESPAAGVSLR